MKANVMVWMTFLFLVLMTPAQSSRAEDRPGAPPGGDAALAQELTNPLADLMNIPIQMNYDQGIGPRDEGWKLGCALRLEQHHDRAPDRHDDRDDRDRREQADEAGIGDTEQRLVRESVRA